MATDPERPQPIVNTITDERAAQLKAEAIAARHARRAPWQKAHADRLARDREAREAGKQYRKTQAQQASGEHKQCSGCQQTLPLEAFGLRNEKPDWRCKPCENAYARAYYRRKHGLSGSGVPRGTISPERRREAAERIAYLTAILTGTAGSERINSQQGWDMATSELHSLWIQSGEKECVSCKAIVPPSAMLPPISANFYPGKCRSCARAEYYEHSFKVYGRLSEGPRLIPMRDGSAITVAELARRCLEREQGHRTKRTS